MEKQDSTGKQLQTIYNYFRNYKSFKSMMK